PSFAGILQSPMASTTVSAPQSQPYEALAEKTFNRYKQQKAQPFRNLADTVGTAPPSARNSFPVSLQKKAFSQAKKPSIWSFFGLHRPMEKAGPGSEPAPPDL